MNPHGELTKRSLSLSICVFYFLYYTTYNRYLSGLKANVDVRDEIRLNKIFLQMLRVKQVPGAIF
jgi:hypothetical protein